MTNAPGGTDMSGAAGAGGGGGGGSQVTMRTSAGGGGDHGIVPSLSLSATSSTSSSSSVSASAPSGRSRNPPFWLGGAAAMLATVVTHPIDQTKIRLQTVGASSSSSAASSISAYSASTSASSASSPSSPSMLAIARRSITTSTWRPRVLALWQGLSASLLRQATYGTARFGVYAWLKERRADAGSRIGRGRIAGTGSSPASPSSSLPAATPPPPPLLAILDGAIAGLVAGLVGSPAELVLVRMCSDAFKPDVRDRYAYRHALEGVWRIATSREGAGAAWKGWQLTCARSMLVNASQLASYDAAKSTLLLRFHLPDTPLVHTLSSTLASTIATTVCTPVDVIKARYQAQARRHQEGTGRGGLGAIRAVITSSIEREGPRVLLRGWLPAWLRMTPTMTLTFVIMEQLKKVF